MNIKSSLRAAIYQAEKNSQRLRFANEPQNELPILLGISFPKSGTHLLDQILLGFNRVAPFSKRLHSFYAEYEGESGKKRESGQAIQWLKKLNAGDVASAHLFARDEAVTHVALSSFAPFFIFRDPRDVVVSHVFYVTDIETHHVHHSYYHSLPDFNSRLNVSILGRPELNAEFLNIKDRFTPYLGWLDSAAVMKIHFEELIHARAEVLSRIVDHVGSRVQLKAPRARILEALEESINPKKSPTFRSGKTGEWKKYFTDEHKNIFKEVSGDLLIKLGYEKDNTW